jgi:hypothetical protein
LQPALSATNTIIFFDPEHLTAVNYRKRRLVKLYEEKDQESDFEDVLEIEISFVTSILTSPLHRQTKSPTLWYHRFWLFSFCLEHSVGQGSQNAAPLQYAQTVLQPIFKSGERHPMNYHAWQYARRVVNRLQETTLENALRPNPWLEEFLMACALAVKGWCCQHPSDTSGWSFLLFLLPRLCTSQREHIVKQVLDFATNLDARQESLWVFLRTVLADNLLGQARDEFFDRLKSHMNRYRPRYPTDHPKCHDAPVLAVEWIENNKKIVP